MLKDHSKKMYLDLFIKSKLRNFINLMKSKSIILLILILGVLITYKKYSTANLIKTT